jgi:hypothetical protein
MNLLKNVAKASLEVAIDIQLANPCLSDKDRKRLIDARNKIRGRKNAQRTH